MKILAISVFLFIVGNNAYSTEEIVSGVLRDGMMAIGGETTGYFLQVDKKRMEVSLPEEAIQNFKKWHGKNVSLVGKNSTLKSVERGERKIFLVSSVVLQKLEKKAPVKVQKTERTKVGFLAKLVNYIGIK